MSSLLLIVLTACASTGISGSNKYIFYLHGSVEEEEGATDKYEMAVSAVSRGSAKVISEVRGATDPNEYAEKIKAQVNELIAEGVVPSDITITGFSKGAVIALAASTTLKHPEINYVLLAGCSDMLNAKYRVDPNAAVGRVLSIYDVDDEKFGSCQSTLKPSQQLIFEEVELNTGKGHKLFRIPKDKFIQQWRDPLLDWAGA